MPTDNKVDVDEVNVDKQDIMGFAREVADRILFLDAGRLAEDAPPSVFFSTPKRDRAQQFLQKVL